jgi:diguanylate cyclase (GGDEF)-like protein
MFEWWSSLNSGMSRRLLLATGCACFVVLLAVVAVVAGNESARQQESQQATLDSSANLFASTLSARLMAADEAARALVTADAGVSGQALRARVKNARVFTGVILLDTDSTGFARAGAYEFRFSRAQLGTLLAGGSALISVPIDTQLTGLFLARSVSEGGGARVAAFELAPDWLWSPLSELPDGIVLAALDARGTVIHGADAAPELAGLVGSGVGGSLRTVSNRHLAWQARGAAWEGSLTALDMGDAVTSPPLAIVVAARHPSFWSRFTPVAAGLPLLLLVALVATLWAALQVANRYVPALRELQMALRDLAEQRLTPLRAPADRELGDVYESFNGAVSVIGRQLATMRAQGEIDELLLGAAEVEAVLDPVLVRLRDVMSARAVGLTLIDADATGYGRLFVASSDNLEWPVSRVPLDPQVMDVFASSPEGLTIGRCEDGRHSFLMPLTRVGAQFFWAWPVYSGERLAAILSVGYGEAPKLDARLASHGTDCARRLGTVLSRGARAEHLYRQAHYDPLTQLPNRLLFRDRLEQAISAAGSAASRGALLYIDLDHFKKVNDSLGHAAGDQLLTIVGQRLRACVKEGDTVARLAGDEFTIILHQVADPGAARHVAQRVIETLQLPVNLGGKDHQVRASIGITLFPDDGASIDELMRNADLAMYRAKDQGRGASVFFDRGMMTRHATVPDTGLYRALKRREFSLFYQPQYSVVDGSLLGVEALLRWDSPRGGLRSPAEFVPAAEECGLIVDIGSWVVEAACAQLSSWRGQSLPMPCMAVNVSLQQLHDTGFVPLVKRLLDKYALPADMLELELTESAFTDPEAQEALQGLARLGVGLALDDFGTGYSALNHLRRYPVRTVKIDRSFIEDVAENPASATMAEAIIAMAHTLGKKVVAEGVETVEQLDFLRERGCDIAQGYYLARPIAAAGMSELLAARLPALPDVTAAAG